MNFWDSGTAIAEMIMVGQDVVKRVGEEFSDELAQRGHVGGYFSLLHPDFSEVRPVLTFGVGEINKADREMVERYYDYSREKPMRARSFGKSNSFIAFRDPEQGRWGGGFWITVPGLEFGIGFSGLPEKFDAICCMLLLVRLNILSVERATGYIKQCKVPELDSLWQKSLARALHC